MQPIGFGRTRLRATRETHEKGAECFRAPLSDQAAALASVGTVAIVFKICEAIW